VRACVWLWARTLPNRSCCKSSKCCPAVVSTAQRAPRPTASREGVPTAQNVPALVSFNPWLPWEVPQEAKGPARSIPIPRDFSRSPVAGMWERMLDSEKNGENSFSAAATAHVSQALLLRRKYLLFTDLVP